MNKLLEITGSSSLVADRQSDQASQSKVGSPTQRPLLQRQFRHAPQDGRERNLAFNARQRSPEAEVGRPTKGKMPVICSSNIQPVRIRKPLRIAIGRAHDSYDCVSFANFPAA